MPELGSIVDFLLPAGLGFFIGVIFGVFLAGLMSAASEDSRLRERMEEEEQNRKENEKAIRQLEGLRDHCQDMAKDEWSGEVWEKDVEALTIAIEKLGPRI